MKNPGVLVLLLIAAAGAWWLLRGRTRGLGEGPISPGQPGTPDRTAQNPKTVPWRG